MRGPGQNLTRGSALHACAVHARRGRPRGSASPTAARQTDLPGWKERDNSDHRRIRARVEHTFAAMKTWKILRDCRRRGHGVYWATTGVAHLRNLALAG